MDGVGPQAALPSDVPETSAVHDLGDVSLLPGFVETHIPMHYASPVDYRDIARPEPVERMVIRAMGHMRDLLLSGATTARDTGSRDARSTPAGRPAASGSRLRCRSARACAAPWPGTSPTATKRSPATTERSRSTGQARI